MIFDSYVNGPLICGAAWPNQRRAAAVPAPLEVPRRMRRSATRRGSAAGWARPGVGERDRVSHGGPFKGTTK